MNEADAAGDRPDVVDDGLQLQTGGQGVAGTLDLNPTPREAAAMASKADLVDWVVEALEQLGGSARVIDVSKRVWRNHEADLRESGDLFYTWQYDLRWAATKLRKSGQLKPSEGRVSGAEWVLA